MPFEFKLPDLGENIESGDVVNVLVKEGDVVEANQPVVELETDKAVVEVPCPQAGRVVKLHIKQGDTLPVGGLILTLEAGATAASAPTVPSRAPVAAAQQPAPRIEAPPTAPAPQPAPGPSAPLTPPARPATPASVIPTGSSWSSPAATPETAPAGAATSTATSAATEPIAAGPAIRRLARELGIDLTHVTGTGAEGRITRDDVVSAVRNATSRPAGPAAAPARQTTPPGTTDHDAWGTVRREKLTKIRKTIAANMVRSKNTIPHVTNFDEADVTELERIRKGSQQDYSQSNVKLTMMVFVMKAVAHALKLHPQLNASLDEEHEHIVYKEYVNLGVAVDTDRGLIVPVLRNVDRMTLPQVAYALTELAGKARANQFALDDLRGGSFTISNLGAVGGVYSTPIINHPEVAILLTGRSRKMPVVVEDRIESRLMMPLSLSYDHRLVDGATAARFLNEVIGFLQAPGRLLLAP